MVAKSSVEQAKAHIRFLAQERKITQKNAKRILGFVAQLQAQGHKRGPYSKKRLTKYLYGLGSLCQMTKKDFETATRDDMNALASQIRENYGKETARDYLVILRLFVKYIWEKKGFEYEENEFPDVVKKIRPGNIKTPKIPRAQLLTMEDVKEMANLTKNLRDRCFVITLYESGCRIGELIGDETHPGVLLRDIKNDQYGTIIDVDGKTGMRSLRLIASAPAIANWLQEHPDRDNRNAPLFCGIWGVQRGKRIDYRYWNNLLTGKADNRKRPGDEKVPMRGLGELAGIQKPTNPHWFRHSRASELAKYMTESQLCYYMGWEQGSKQARIYVHLSGKDVDTSILQMYGLAKEEKQENEMKPLTCPRCNKVNDPFAKFCSGCSLGLDMKTMLNFERTKDELTSNVVSLIGDRDQALKTLEALTKLLQNNK